MPIFMSRTFKTAFHRIRQGSLVACLAIYWVLTAGTLWAEQQETDSAPNREIRFAALQGIYPNVSRTDGRLALELLMQKTIVRESYPYAIKLSFIDPETDIPKAIQRGAYHFVTLSSIDYFKYRHTVHLEPILIPTKIKKPTESLLFLVAKDQTLSTIRQKEARSLIIEAGTSGDLSRIWLDTLLLDKGLPKSKQFFTQIRRVHKPARALIPVFFNQADACIITQHALNVMKELNPQINQRIKTLYQSKHLIRLMICATDKPKREEIETLVRESINMEKNPDTQQAMTILQMNRFVPIVPEDLVATEQLLAHHDQINAGHTQ